MNEHYTYSINQPRRFVKIGDAYRDQYKSFHINRIVPLQLSYPHMDLPQTLSDFVI